MSVIHQILQQYWGFNAFRPLQEDIIQNILDQKDTLALLPTGGGKSICYQVPALAMDGICIVVSPLIALIKDQVDNLELRGIPALMIYSGMGFKQVNNVLKLAVQGNHKFLFVSPERLETKLFLEYLPALQISMIAVDEAHCISQWGYDFRPPYLRIAQIKTLIGRVPILALTASATKKVQTDICDKLEFEKGFNVFQKSFIRPNLSYSIIEAESKIVKAVDILQKVAGTAIVYCNSRKRTQEIAKLLMGYGINADFYHAGLNNEIRSTKQQNWIDDKIRVMVSTNAFGMGIDKSNVRVVIHIDLPDCLENYYQEAGRAGRDEAKAYAVLLATDSDTEKLAASVDIKYPPIDVVKQCYVDLCNYLQLHENTSTLDGYEFDIITFAKNFDYSPIALINCIKLLEQNNLLQYSASVMLPASAQIVCNKQTLSHLAQTNEPLSELAKTLLRTYGGIWDFMCFINEKNLAYILRKDVKYVQSQMQRLHQMGIIQYQPLTDEPQIFLLQNRLKAEMVTINQQHYNERKQHYKQSLDHFISFIKNKNDCKSLQISTYFGVAETTACGICDNCIAKQKTNQKTNIPALAEHILSIMQQYESVDIEYFNQQKNKEHWFQAIQLLLSEEKIVQDLNKIKLNK